DLFGPDRDRQVVEPLGLAHVGGHASRPLAGAGQVYDQGARRSLSTNTSWKYASVAMSIRTVSLAARTAASRCRRDRVARTAPANAALPTNSTRSIGTAGSSPIRSTLTGSR